MTFDTLNKVETRFKEIAYFYACLNERPFEVLTPLLENPATQRLIQAGKYRPSPTTQSEVVAGYEVPQTRLFKPTSAPSDVSNVRLDSLALRRYEPDEEQQDPNTGQGYKIGFNDVLWWVDFARLVPLREELPEPLRRELSHAASDAEERSRAVRIDCFVRLLDTVNEQVSRFEGKTLAEFLAEVNDDTTGYLKTDWGSIFEAAKSLVSEVCEVVAVFRAVVGQYVPSAGKKEPQNGEETRSNHAGHRAKGSIQFKPVPRGQTGLTQHQTALLMEALRDNGIIYRQVEKTTLAACFSAMTGFSSATLYQSITGLGAADTALPEDFDAVIGQLERLLRQLKDKSGQVGKTAGKKL